MISTNHNEICWVVLGAGKSLLAFILSIQRLETASFIACNRAIELFRADYWIWVDRMHFERSQFHSNARKAIWVGPVEEDGRKEDTRRVNYQISRTFPCEESHLFLGGGTLTVATHFALRKGASRIVFVGCDAWSPGRDRYHVWDGRPLDEQGQVVHREHLARTAEGVRVLADAHPHVEFFDATTSARHLGFPFIKFESLLPRHSRKGEKPCPRKRHAKSSRINRCPLDTADSSQ